MRRLAHLPLSALFVLGVACDKGEADASSTAPAASPDADASPRPAASSDSAPVPRLEGAIELPAATPAGAIAVLAVRVPSSMFESVVAADPLGIATEGMVELKADLDEFLGRTVGVKVLDATSATVFVLGEKDLGVVLTGVEGGIKSKKAGEHGGVALHGEDSAMMAQLGDTLVVGTESAVKAAIDANTDATKSAKGGELAGFVAAQSEGASMAIAADLAKFPTKLTRQIPPGVMVERGIVVFGWQGLTLRVEGKPENVDALAGMVKSGLAMASDAAESQRKEALTRTDDVVEGAAAILSAHYMRSAKRLLEPKVEGGVLTMSVPMKAGDPAILAAVSGMAAAVAIPALTKYMRRSKTAEARVQIAKMFDGASAYFYEEHIPSAAAEALAAAPHSCPNNGKLKGQSGITPPLTVDCSEGPGGRCVPSAPGESAPGHYDRTLWESDVWKGLGFAQEQPHAFHYNFIWANDAEGYGACQFTAQAFGDLDGDGVFSTYERAGAGDENGLNGAAGLYIDQEVE